MRRSTAWVLSAGLTLGLFGADDPKGVAVSQAHKEQVWEGKLPIGAGLSLRLVLRVTTDADGKQVATIDSPDQGAKGLKVDSVSVDKTTLTFEMKNQLTRYEGAINPEGTEAKGTFAQGGAKLPLTLKRTEKATELRRPQTPKAPFPYRAEDVTYRNEAGGVTLAGTLTLPEGSGPFPAALLISGSGAQDRDETIFEHKPFLVIADALTRKGVAVLRVDDRGVGGSTGSTGKSTSEDFAGDVLAGVEYLRSRKEIDARGIGLIGHSEGGVIAPMVAARSGDVAFLVLLAGTGLPGDEILKLQNRLILKAVGADERTIDRQLAFLDKMGAVVRAERDAKAAEPKLRALLDELKAGLSAAEQKEFEAMGSVAETQLKVMASPWMRFFLTYDPRPALAKVRCPVLALVGEKDLQVPPRENLAEIEKALKAAGNRKVNVQQVAGVNHLFQTSQTGSPAEYATIEETIAPAALDTIVGWVVEQGRNRGPAK
jgi:pimeloyl-ACP methyl ester carboxylesterase